MKFIGLFALWVFALNVQAGYFSEDGGIEFSATQVNDCFNLDDNRQVRLCVDYFYRQAGNALESELKRIRAVLKKDTDLFNDAQHKWLIFKGSECAVQAVGARAFADPSTTRELLTWACLATMDEQRVGQLKSIQLNCVTCLE